MKRSEWVACIFFGTPCIVALLLILPVKSMIGGIFGVSCVVMTIMIANARAFEEIRAAFKKEKKGKDV